MTLEVRVRRHGVGDVVYVQSIGAYSCASALTFNGIRPAKVIVV